ncbi:MAG TPA: LPS assembly lipoprotein LptE [Terriglobales bacterium]|nr:LPS assembly lipoprotein LptE [Terriglobales bacterium]
MKQPPLACLLGLCIAFSGCGYHTAGHVTTLPEDVRTIAIPAFVNNTQSYRVEQLLTAAVVHEFTTRTRYRIVNDASDPADATLRGTVTGMYVVPTAVTPSGTSTIVQIGVSMGVTVTNRQGKILYQNPSFVFRQQYQISRDLAQFFQEDTPALQRLSRQFAETLVSNILEGF